MGAEASGSVWGTCRYCGTAVGPGATECWECGADKPVAAGAFPSAPAPVRRRLVFTAGLRALIVAGLAIALAVALVSAVLTGPPNPTDPLTTSGTYTTAPGSIPLFEGSVTGGDYVVGNFSSVVPDGADVSISVYNATAWVGLLQNGSGSPAWSTPTEGSGRIIFSPLVTGTYIFVLTNPYPAASHVNVTVYVATTYESNVGDDGFG